MIEDANVQALEEILVDEITLTLIELIPTGLDRKAAEIVAREILDRDVMPRLRDAYDYGVRSLTVNNPYVVPDTSS